MAKGIGVVTGLGLAQFRSTHVQGRHMAYLVLHACGGSWVGSTSVRSKRKTARTQHRQLFSKELLACRAIEHRQNDDSQEEAPDSEQQFRHSLQRAADTSISSVEYWIATRQGGTQSSHS